MSRPEQRQSERIATKLAIRIERGDTVIEAYTINMSLGGVLVAARFNPPVHMGERFAIALVLPTLEQPLRAQAEVRWVGVTGECGLQFTTGFRARETWAIGQWLDKLRKESP